MLVSLCVSCALTLFFPFVFRSILPPFVAEREQPALNPAPLFFGGEWRCRCLCCVGGRREEEEEEEKEGKKERGDVCA